VSLFVATYRLQLKPGFGFDEVADLADYLAELGISHVYCSPYLQAAPGSEHGYDVVDYGIVNHELGGDSAYERMCAALKRCCLGQLMDVVPNHMAISAKGNRWWWDVLENGPSSRYASFFDVDWEPPEARLRNTILLPMLGEQYGKALRSGAIRLRRRRGVFEVVCNDQELPAAPRSLASILREAATRANSDELALIADILHELPLPTTTDQAERVRRHRDRRVIGYWLDEMLSTDRRLSDAIDQVIAELNLDYSALHAFLESQNYRLAYWRAAERDLGYRRFFDINSLIGLRMEDAEVFAETHALTLDLLDRGAVAGLRIDHIDGLRNPEAYLRRLREAAPAVWLVVEKILEEGERLPDSWPVDGTTGYDFMSLVDGLFIDAAAELELTATYEQFIGHPSDYSALVRDKKRLVLDEVLGSDLNRLTAMLLQICEGRPDYRDYSRHDLHEALKAITIELPVYRTYVNPETGECSDQDRRYIIEAIASAKKCRADIDAELFDFLQGILLLTVRGELENELAQRLQQFTGPVMAKAVEDTTFYCYNRLLCLNEVGGNPLKFGTTRVEFYRRCVEIQAKYPCGLSATSTHDTKRSEDVRARVALLTEIPEEWRARVSQWSAHNDCYWQGPKDRNLEYLIYQTLVGAWPISRERMHAYVEKAMREAKEHTSWSRPQKSYEQAVRQFVDNLFEDEWFVGDLGNFVELLVEPGRVNSLACTLIKLTAPGVPDFYQGSELWCLTLVDPDNRMPVDFATRRRLLRRLRDGSLDEVRRGADEGLPKLWTIRQGLATRRRYPEAFGRQGSFLPLQVRGGRARHVVAYCRGGVVTTIVPRLIMQMRGDWQDTAVELLSGEWRNVLDDRCFQGGSIGLRELTSQFPVALLVREDT